MPKALELDLQYAEAMKSHPFGIALYRPLPRSLFNPGACGYFDDFGSWNPIGHLGEGDLLLKRGLKPLEDDLEGLRAPVDNGIKWGPKISSNTTATKIELSGGVDPATGIPITASAVYSYSTQKAVGAILLTSSPISHERYYHQNPFKNWVEGNAAAILQRWPEVKTHGFWIVTSIFACKECAVNMWTTRGRGFKVGFSAKFAGIGEAGPSGEWYRDKVDGGWAEYKHEGDDKCVVFFGGLKFLYSWMSTKELKMKGGRPSLRAPSSEDSEEITTITDINSDDGEEGGYLVDCEEYFEELSDEDE